MTEGGDDAPDEIPEVKPESDESNEVPEETPDDAPDDAPDDTDNETDDPFDEYVPDADPDNEPDDPFDENVPDADPDNEPDDPFDENVPDADPDNEPDDPFDENVPDADPDNEPYDPFKEYEPNSEPESEPDEEVNNPSNTGTITVVVPEQPEEVQDPDPEETPEEIDHLVPEGDSTAPVESPEIMNIRKDLEEAGYEPEYEPEQDSETIPEQEPEIAPEQDPEYEPEQDSELIPKQEPEQNSEVVPEQQQKKTQKKKHIKAKKLELITDPQELEKYKHYEYQHIIKTKYDPIFSQKQIRKPQKKPAKKQISVPKKKPIKAKKLKPITDPKELGEFKHYEYSHAIKTKSSQNQAQKKPEKSEKSEKKSESSQKTEKKSKPEEIEELELIVEPIETEKSEEGHESSTEPASEQLQKVAKNRSRKQEAQKSSEISKEKVNETIERESQTQKKTAQNVKAKKQEKTKIEQKLEPISTEILELRKKYRQETGKRPIYNKKNTKGFTEWLEKRKKVVLKKSKSVKKSESRGEWEILLEKWINEFDEKELSQETKEELMNIVRKYRKFTSIYRKIIQLVQKENLTKKESDEIEGLLKNLEKMTAIQANMFRNLRAFQGYYNENILWNKYLIIAKKEKFIKFLVQKLKNLKKTKGAQKIVKKNWKEILKENLHKSTTLNLNEKSIMNRILLKEELTEGDKKELIFILSKLSTEQLILLLGVDFRIHVKNYVRWGWDFDLAVKKLMLQNFLKTSALGSNLGENDLTSEFIGILLGDGNLFSKNYQNQLDVSLNQIDEPQYVSYVKNLMETLLNKEIKICKHKGKGISLRVYSKLINQTLVNLGLKVGNKVENQVGVPNFILKIKRFIIRCLKGLFDTDGSINVENKRALRLSFQNSSKPLVTGFYRMCLALDIIPSPTIRYDEKRVAWRVDIAKKDSIKKFFQIIKPEKLKEPLRRIWIASKLIYLNSSESEQQIIHNKIKSWLKQNNKKIFNYSKKSALFLKNTCEKTLNIDINFDLINKSISKALELEKYMYDKTRTEHLKYLYEKLRSTYRIIEYLINQGEINIPHRQTITSHLKKYFKKKNLNYQKWLKENPKMRIGINDDRHFRVFPMELRNLLNEKICRILMRYKNKIPETKIIKLLKQEFQNQDLIIMIWLLNSPEYNQPTYQYLNNLIFLNKKLIENYINKKKTNMTLLSKDPHVPFDRRTITLMVDHLISKGILKQEEKR